MLVVFLIATVVCGVASFPKHHVNQLEASLPPIVCTDCKKYVGQLENYLETATKQQVEARILALCKVIPVLADECTDIVTKSFDEIYDFINTNLKPDQICSLIGLCDETNVHEPQMPSAIDFYLEKSDDVECDFCQQIFQYVKELITSNTTKEEFKNILLGVCSHLGNLEKQCEDFVNNNFDMIYDLIVIELDPKTVCTALGLCDQAKVYEVEMRSAIDFNLEKYTDNGFECDFCQQTVQYVVDLIRMNSTEEEFKDLLLGICKHLGTYEQTCDDFVNENFEALLELIVNELDPKTICTSIRLCGETKTIQKRSVINFNLEKTNVADCGYCQQIVQYVKGYIATSMTEDQFKQMLLGICTNTGVYQPVCDDFVNNNYDAAYNYIVNQLDPKALCAAVGLCDQKNVYKPKTRSVIDFNLDKTNVGDCGYCQQIVQYVKGYIATSMTEDQFKQMLLGVCTNTGVYQPVCDDFVNNNYDVAYNYIVNQLDTKALCAAVGLCDQKNVYKPKTRSVIDFNLDKTNVADCGYCQQIVQYVKGYIATSMTEEQFKQMLLGICTNTGVYQPLCDDFVNSNYDVAYNYIVNQLDPKALCAAIGLCDQTKKRSVIDFNREKSNGEECILCETAIQYVIDLIDTTSTEDDVKNILFGVCKRFGKLDQVCDDLVNNYVQVIFNLIVEKVTPQEICRTIRLCDQISRKTQSLPLTKLTPSKKSPAYHELHDIKAPSFTCNLCKFALQEIQNMLNNNNTEENIKHAIETVCDVLPKSITEECKDFIETYGDAILILVSQELDPTLVCVAIGLCDSVEAPVDIQLPARLTVAETNVKTSVCDICQTVIGVIHVILQDNKTKEAVEHAVEHALESICNELPQQYQADCKSFIDEYTEQLIDLVVNNDPDTICASFDLCTGSKKTVAKPTSTRQR